ncbi:glycoside hydrolase superfamily [Phellopilus nigrolimitatus]|nr:glycoside hydrolase superfamily [Phellopilus nigrolimitatus]
MTSWRERRNSHDNPDNVEEVALLSQEERLERTTVDDADQYDEHDPLTGGASFLGGSERPIRRIDKSSSNLSSCLCYNVRSRKRFCFICAFFIGFVLLLLSGGSVVYKTAPKVGLSPPWYPSPLGGTLSPWQESYEKATRLVNQMSLIEKVNITTGTGWQMGLCVGNTGPANNVKFPSLCLQDGPLGIRFTDHATAFPAGVTVGATWNRDLMYKRGRLHGSEARLKGVNILLGPSMGPLGRMPAGGRVWEGFGADPVLQGVAASETIKGIQDEGVIATAKHYILNEQEHFRQSFEWGLPNALSANIDDRTLHEIYLWPFAESVRAGVASVMCSYQMVNNSYACGNSKLLNGILKDELGFQGFMQSDWLAQRSGVASALAGLDMSMPGDGLHWANGASLWGAHLTAATLNGSLPITRLNDMVMRIVAAYYQLGQDDPSRFPPGGPNFSSWTDDRVGYLYHGTGGGERGVVNKFVDVQGKGNDSHGLRQIGAEAITLLKNEDGVLPLSRDGGSNSNSRKLNVVIVGEDAGEGKGRNYCKDRGCNQGTLAVGWGSGATEFPYLITPEGAIKAAFNTDRVSVTSFLSNAVPPIGTLEGQDICLVFVNSDSGEGYISPDGVTGDRPDLYPQKGGDRLVQAVTRRCGRGKGKTVVVVHSVGPVVVDRWVDMDGVKALLFAHLPGQESGNSLADVLFGDVNPSGKLPYTVGKNLKDYGAGGQILFIPNGVIPQQNFDEGLYIDYRHFDKYSIAPRYEFGFGLSYTSFSFSNLTITSTKPKSAFPSPRPDGISPPVIDETIPPAAEALYPSGFKKLRKYIYPYLEKTTDVKRGKYPYPDGYDVVQPLSQAGGGEGGNPSLWDVHAEVEVSLSNTGQRTGKEVVQLYVSFPENVYDGEGPYMDFPLKVLRGFEKVELAAGESRNVKFELTRKDLSYWSAVHQNWVMPTQGRFRIHVGNSSRSLPLSDLF